MPALSLSEDDSVPWKATVFLFVINKDLGGDARDRASILFLLKLLPIDVASVGKSRWK